jgi:hypothetical protein
MAAAMRGVALRVHILEGKRSNQIAFDSDVGSSRSARQRVIANVSDEGDRQVTEASETVGAASSYPSPPPPGRVGAPEAPQRFFSRFAGILAALFSLVPLPTALAVWILQWIAPLALLIRIRPLAHGVRAALLLVVLRFGARIGRIGLAHRTLLMLPASRNRYQRIWLHPAARVADANSRKDRTRNSVSVPGP